MCRWFVYVYSLTNKLPVPLTVVTIFFRTMHNKTIIWFDFCDIQNNQGRRKGYQPKPKAETTSSNNCFVLFRVAFIISTMQWDFGN